MKNPLRERVRPLLLPYLKAERCDIHDDYVDCPKCGGFALLDKENGWRCPRCQIGGDTWDYARLLHPELGELELAQMVYAVLGLRLPELPTVGAGALLDMELPAGGYLIDGLLGRGLTILAGASKIGKSWLVLYLADCLSRGKPVWGLKTEPCEVLYVSLEDTRQRIRQRLSEVSGGEPGGLYIATEAQLLGQGFEEQLAVFLTGHPKVRLVIIDTLQRIRQVRAEQYSYAGDYETMSALKALADEFGAAILLVHHTRKMESSDSFDLISGTTGLMGSADGAWVLRKASRLAPEATLDVTGRELADRQLRLRFDEQSKRWDFIGFSHEEPQRADPLLEAVSALMAGREEWQGTATQLREALGKALGAETNPAALSRRLNAASDRLLQDYGLRFSLAHNSRERRVREGRWLSDCSVWLSPRSRPWSARAASRPMRRCPRRCGRRSG